LGLSKAASAVNGFADSKFILMGNYTSGKSYGNFDAGGEASSTSGANLAIPFTGSAGTPAFTVVEGSKKSGKNVTYVAAQNGVAPLVLFGNPTGGEASGFGFTNSGGFGSSLGNTSMSEASGSGKVGGFGSAEGQSLFGKAKATAGGNGQGNGGGIAEFGFTTYNGTGGGFSDGFSQVFVGGPSN
jgi:hypothetical protein